MGINNYSTTAADNASVSSVTTVHMEEGMPPSAVNNSCRQIMADTREWYEDPQWQDMGWGIPSRVSDKSFSVAGADRTGELHVGRNLKIADVSSNTYYAMITASAWSASTSLNTITVTLNDANTESLSSTLSNFYVSSARADNLAIRSDRQKSYCNSSTSGSNQYLLINTPANISELYQGQIFTFKSDTDVGDGGVTVEIAGGVAVKDIKKNGDAVAAGDWLNGDMVQIVYDGTNFQLLTPPRTPFITDGAIGYAKLADGTDGELITWDAAGAIATVAVGTAGHILTSGGTGVAPEFKATGGMTASSTDTLTNKTFDANGAGNSLSNVDVADLANGTDGEIITWDATGAAAVVAVGTAGHVLTSGGVGVAPEFKATGAGDMLGANNLSDVDDAPTSLTTIGGIGAATSDTLTNKTFDANGTGNALSNVDVADLANGTDGELITWDAAGAAAVVAVGDAGQMLISAGAGSPPAMSNSPILKDYSETVNAIGSVGGGAQNIDMESGNVASATVDTSETTFTFTNTPPNGSQGGVVLYLTNGGSQTVNWTDVDWAAGTAPSLTASGVDVLVFTTIDGATIINGFVAGLDVK